MNMEIRILKYISPTNTKTTNHALCCFSFLVLHNSVNIEKRQLLLSEGFNLKTVIDYFYLKDHHKDAIFSKLEVTP